DRRSDQAHHDADKLWRSEPLRPGYARPGKRLRRQVDEHQGDEERGVRHGPNQNSDHGSTSGKASIRLSATPAILSSGKRFRQSSWVLGRVPALSWHQIFYIDPDVDVHARK